MIASLFGATLLAKVTLSAGLAVQVTGDLGKLKDCFNKGDYDCANSEAEAIVRRGVNWNNPELVVWLAKVVDNYGDMPTAFYLSAFHYIANGRPSSLWNSKDYIFSRDPDRSNLFLNMPEVAKQHISRGNLHGITAASVFVQAQRRLETARSRGLSEGDSKFFKYLESRLEPIWDSLEPGPVDAVLLAATCRFHEVLISVEDLDLERRKKSANDLLAKLGVKVQRPGGAPEPATFGKGSPVMKSLEEGHKQLVRIHYKQIRNLIESGTRVCPDCWALHLLAGKAFLELGTFDNSRPDLSKALTHLERAQKLAPQQSTVELIVRVRRQLSSKQP